MCARELRKILIVEDEPDIQTIAGMALEKLGGFEVGICSTGEEALERAPGFDPDLILMDVMMPGMDGPTTMRELRAIPEITDVPVIFMTAKTQGQEILEFKRMGAAHVVSKPFDPMTLSSTIQEIWDRIQG